MVDQLTNNNNNKKIKELDILDIFKTIYELTLKYKVIIILSFIVMTIIGVVFGLKMDKENRHYRQSIKINTLNTKTGTNLDGTKFNKEVFIKGNEDLTITPEIPEEIRIYLLNRLRAGAEEQYTSPHYFVTTKKGLYTEESKRNLDETIKRNVALYTMGQLPEKTLKEVGLEKINKIEYIERADYFTDLYATKEGNTGEILKLVNLIKISKNISKEDKIIFIDMIEDLRAEINKYKADILKNLYVMNLEESRKKYERHLINSEAEIDRVNKEIEKRNQAIEILPNKDVPLTSLVGGKSYGNIINELGLYILGLQLQEEKYNLAKNYIKNAKEVTKETATRIGQQEQIIINKLNAVITKLNPILLVEENNAKRKELVTIGSPVFVSEISWKKYLIIGAILGIMLGYALAIGLTILEILNKKVKKGN